MGLSFSCTILLEDVFVFADDWCYGNLVGEKRGDKILMEGRNMGRKGFLLQSQENFVLPVERHSLEKDMPPLIYVLNFQIDS